MLTGTGNQIQKINLQSESPMLEIRMLSPSSGNLTLVIPRTVLDKLDQNGKDDAFGLVGNRPVGFNESSTTPSSRTLVIQFDRGVNYIQILGTKTLLTDIGQNDYSSSTSNNILKNKYSLSSGGTIRYSISEGHGILWIGLDDLNKQMRIIPTNTLGISGGKLILQIPRTILDSKDNTGHDSKFVVRTPNTCDPQTCRNISYVEIFRDKIVRTLAIDLSPRSFEIDIVGTESTGSPA